MLSPPLLSASDPVTTSEGSIDPLSLNAVYERLADRILPSLTIRMRRIRLVTAMCVAARVCAADYEDDEVAADGVTPPWLVFEWFVVEALVRANGGADDAAAITRGVPGSSKVRQALGKRPIGHASYLRTPMVFGFSGVFRRLATDVGVLTDDLALDEGGYVILRAWERDVGLDGFCAGADATRGAEFREALRAAVRAGMKVGGTMKRPAIQHGDGMPASPFWPELAHVLHPGTMKQRERHALRAQLVAPGKGVHRGHADELTKAVVKRGRTLHGSDETGFMRSLSKSASHELASCLRAIDAYEALCRPMMDAFTLVRALSTEMGGRPVGQMTFAKHRLVGKLVARLSDGVGRVDDDSYLGTWEPSALRLARTFSTVRSGPALFDTLMQHHEEMQRAKPPDGKRPWFERTQGNEVSIRMRYQESEVPSFNDVYVHEYRVPTLSRFLAELGDVS